MLVKMSRIRLAKAYTDGHNNKDISCGRVHSFARDHCGYAQINLTDVFEMPEQQEEENYCTEDHDASLRLATFNTGKWRRQLYEYFSWLVLLIFRTRMLVFDRLLRCLG